MRAASAGQTGSNILKARSSASAASWRDAASRIGFRAALQPQQTLSRKQYENLHDSGQAAGLSAPHDGFVIESVGTSQSPGINDEGIEYYRFLN